MNIDIYQKLFLLYINQKMFFLSFFLSFYAYIQLNFKHADVYTYFSYLESVQSNRLIGRG